jgi:hypothetical protein
MFCENVKGLVYLDTIPFVRGAPSLLNIHSKTNGIDVMYGMEIYQD